MKPASFAHIQAHPRARLAGTFKDNSRFGVSPKETSAHRKQETGIMRPITQSVATTPPADKWLLGVVNTASVAASATITNLQ